MHKKLLFLLGSLAVSLVLAELVVRIVLPPPQRISYAPGGGGGSGDTLALRARVEEGGLYVTTPTGRRLRPNMHVVIENHALGGRRIEIRTNELGYRNPPIGPKTDRERALFLGDSITWGDWLHEEETFVRRVERLSEGTTRPLETINAAIGAIGLAEEVAILEETGLRIDPDLVVLCWYLNDAQPSRMQPAPKVPDWLSFSHLAYYAGAVAARLAGEQARPRARFDAAFEAEMRRELAGAYPAGPGDPRTDPAAFHAEIAAHLGDWGSAYSTRAQERMAERLARLAALAREHGFELRFVAFPVRLQVEAEDPHDQPQRWLQGVAGELGVPLLDLLPVLRRAHRSGASRLFEDQCHHTPQGNAIVADEVWRFLRER